MSEDDKEAILQNWSTPFGTRPAGLGLALWREFSTASKSHWKPMIESFIGKSTCREMRYFDRNGGMR